MTQSSAYLNSKTSCKVQAFTKYLTVCGLCLFGGLFGQVQPSQASILNLPASVNTSEAEVKKSESSSDKAQPIHEKEIETSGTSKKTLDAPSVKESHRPWSAFAGLGFPQLLQAEGIWTSRNQKWDVVLSGSYLSIPFFGVSASQRAFAVGVQFHPSAGSFYWGLDLGRQRLRVKTSEFIQFFDTKAQVDANATYVQPRLGWMWQTSERFMWGIDLAFYIPLSVNSTWTVRVLGADPEEQEDVQNSSEYNELREQALDAADFLARIPLPAFHIKAGWSF